MSTAKLAIITTRLPPAACGIGTYSWRLQQHQPNEQSRVEFLAMEGSGEGVTAFHGDGAQFERELDRIGGADVLLHYAGRAYQRFGCPFWMPPALARWKRKFPQGRLAIFFHEMPGRFPFTSRHFWLARANAGIIRRLAAIADILMTNTADQLDQVQKISRREDVHLLPVGSNIEAGTASPRPRERTEFLVFGLPFGRWQTLQLFQARIRQWHVEGLLTKLHLVGPNDEEFAQRGESLVQPELLVRHGLLPSAQVAELLRRVGFALTNVSERTWSKSGTFMACAANECPVVIASDPPGLAPLNYLVSSGEVARISNEELSRRTSALAAWYRENADWPVIARRVAALWSSRP